MSPEDFPQNIPHMPSGPNADPVDDDNETESVPQGPEIDLPVEEVEAPAPEGPEDVTSPDVESPAETPEHTAEHEQNEDSRRKQEILDELINKYADMRLEWAIKNAKYNKLSHDQLKVGEKLLSHSQDESVKERFREITTELEMAQKEKTGNSDPERTFERLLEIDPQGLEQAEKLFFEKHAAWMGKNHGFAQWVIPGGMELEKSIAEIEAEEQLAQLDEWEKRFETLNQWVAEIEKEAKQLTVEEKELLQLKEVDTKRLQEIIERRKKLLDEMNEVREQRRELRNQLQEIQNKRTQ